MTALNSYLSSVLRQTPERVPDGEANGRVPFDRGVSSKAPRRGPRGSKKVWAGRTRDAAGDRDDDRGSQSQRVSGHAIS